ncbi:DNA topoisomerase [Burkholderia cepacia]|uniref:DNA topoisomerase n=1 Tax=Burkholderia cepacia TaxID=292 RepID=UPI00264C8B65|nr:DNA topoisomerase [Burkholderia cepacia]MDN7909660.1 DNA topoisomerase [Burkholderia cepacia]
MNDSRSLAHPMIEPLDYSLSPEKARTVLSGNALDLYSLLWNAALATIAEGPAIRAQKLVLTASNPTEDSITAFLQSRSQCIEVPGWLEILPSEIKPTDTLTVALPELIQTTLDAAPKQLEADGSRFRGPDACAPAVALLGAPRTWVCEIVEDMPLPLSYDALIEQMASNGVGRPSTFAKALRNAVKNEVVVENDGRLTVGEHGQAILEALTSLPDADVVNARFCSDLEAKLEEVEIDASSAGSVLAEFSKRALGTSTGLASWLDELVIEGESLNDAMRRAANTLPPADSWGDAVLPFGIDPLRLVAHPEQAVAARSELDAMLAAADIPRWKALSSRARALRRVAAIASACSTVEAVDWTTRCSRDIAWRWWIDLGPNEVPLQAHELCAVESEVSVVDEQQAAELAELYERVIKAID